MTHHLAALLKDVPRYRLTGYDAGTQPDGAGDYVAYHEVLAALEAATPPDLVEAGKVLAKLQSQIGDDVQDVYLPEALHKLSADTIRALIALATAQAAQIAGLEDKLAFVQRREIASNTEFDEVWSEAQAEAATLRAEVERLRGALDQIAWSNDSKWQADCARAALEGKA